LTPTARTSGGHIPVDSLVGYPALVAAPASKTLNLAKAFLVSTVAGTITVYDRVWACSGFAGNVATAQDITGFPALPASRAPGNGEGLEMWLESYTAIGATATSVQVTYTNQSGVAGRTTIAETMIQSFPVTRMHRLRLQDGDTGVQSIQSLILSNTSGTAGNFGITLLQRKCMIPIPLASAPVNLDFAALGLPSFDPDAAIQFIHQGTITTTGTLVGTLNLVAG
jgi:hypothetical protein